ncbi:MAG: hypothetical protein AB1758_16510 [Candidatus Eremiobacterota bacterium]
MSASDSPYFLLTHLVARFRSGDVPYEEFMERLDVFEEKLEEWFQDLELNPPPEGFEDGMDLMQTTQYGLFLFLKSIEALREFADGGPEEKIATALQRALAAHQYIVEVQETSDWLLGELIADILGEGEEDEEE